MNYDRTHHAWELMVTALASLYDVTPRWRLIRRWREARHIERLMLAEAKRLHVEGGKVTVR